MPIKMPSKTYVKVRETKTNKFTITEVFQKIPELKDAKQLLYIVESVEKTGEEDGWIIVTVKMKIMKV